MRYTDATETKESISRWLVTSIVSAVRQSPTDCETKSYRSQPERYVRNAMQNVQTLWNVTV